ncbi:MAG: V-type ATP synthase subunit I [Clostridia bacterium]|nr:V-type ATP synthase subunit I [Clostridia bacterium]
MITPMEKITICGLNSQRKTVMERLQKSGCVEFIKSDDSELISVNVSESVTQFERYLSLSADALEIIDEYSPAKTGMLSVRKDKSLQFYSMQSEEIKTTGTVAMDIINTVKDIKEREAQIGTINARISAISQWAALDVPMNYSGSKTVETALYTYPEILDKEGLDSLLEEVGDYVTTELVSSSREISCIFAAYLKDFKDDVTRVFREKGFTQPAIGLSRRTPKDKIINLHEKIAKLNNEIESLKQKITKLSEQRDEIQLFHDHLVLRRDKYKALENVSLTEETFIIEGYIPKNKSEHIQKKLSDLICTVELSAISEDEEAPVLFKNNSVVSPVEGITASYSMPSKHDIDPNAVMSFFYYLFFGMMFSDAGYGLLMVLVCGFLGFIAKVESGLRQFMRMFFYCGISTMFWGFMYGGFFGDIIPGLKPLWINPIDEPLMLLIFSVALGVIQIMIGLILKFYVDFRAGERVSAIFDTLSWVIVLFGAALAIIGFVLGYDIVIKVGIGFAAVGVLMILFMKNRTTWNPITRLFSGIIGLYDITSYVSDFLSYSRLMALGLATGVIANVVNIMAKLGGGGIVGTIAFVLIFIVGHALNFAINILGAYVHTNRLQYVEFYSKFYEGGGRAFSPLDMNTKYYNFMEVKE